MERDTSEGVDRDPEGRWGQLANVATVLSACVTGSQLLRVSDLNVGPVFGFVVLLLAFALAHSLLGWWWSGERS